MLESRSGLLDLQGSSEPVLEVASGHGNYVVYTKVVPYRHSGQVEICFCAQIYDEAVTRSHR